MLLWKSGLSFPTPNTQELQGPRWIYPACRKIASRAVSFVLYVVQRISNIMGCGRWTFLSYLLQLWLWSLVEMPSSVQSFPGLKDSVLWWFWDLGTWDLTENMCSSGWDVCTRTLSCISQGFCESSLMYNFPLKSRPKSWRKASHSMGTHWQPPVPIWSANLMQSVFALSWVMWMVWMYSPALCHVAVGIFGPGLLWNSASVPWGTVLWAGSWK